MLARKWLNANFSCCLIVSNALSNMLSYFEIWQMSLTIVFSVADHLVSDLQPGTQHYDINLLKPSVELPTLDVMSQENGCHVTMVYCLKTATCCRLADFPCLNNLLAVSLNSLSCENQWCDGLHGYPSLWLASQILKMTQPISWQTFPLTATSSGSLLLADMERSGGRRGREGGVSRLQVAARSTYGLRRRARSEMGSDCFIGNSPQERIAFVIISNHFFVWNCVIHNSLLQVTSKNWRYWKLVNWHQRAKELLWSMPHLKIYFVFCKSIFNIKC